jgi:tRNA (guanosine-2'-O-)-methyltransferase
MINQQKQLADFFSEFVLPARLKRMEDVLEKRTRHLTVVLEDIYQPQNASAVIRTCECFGVQDLHVIENKNHFDLNPDVVVGSDKWIDVMHYRHKENNTEWCINKLKREGYTVLCTSLHENDISIEEVDINKKTALVFGTELKGISETAMKMADGFVKIPMHGFTESFNISVAASLSVYSVIQRLHASSVNWKMSEEEKLQTKIKWLRGVIKKHELLELEFFTKHGG